MYGKLNTRPVWWKQTQGCIFLETWSVRFRNSLFEVLHLGWKLSLLLCVSDLDLLSKNRMIHCGVFYFIAKFLTVCCFRKWEFSLRNQCNSKGGSLCETLHIKNFLRRSIVSCWLCIRFVPVLPALRNSK